MVEMRMRENDGVQAGRRDRKRSPVEVAQVLQSLKEAAINQDTLASVCQQMLGAGNGAGTAK